MVLFLRRILRARRTAHAVAAATPGTLSLGRLERTQHTTVVAVRAANGRRILQPAGSLLRRMTQRRLHRGGLWSGGKDCVERDGSERTQVASVAARKSSARKQADPGNAAVITAPRRRSLKGLSQRLPLDAQPVPRVLSALRGALQRPLAGPLEPEVVGEDLRVVEGELRRQVALRDEPRLGGVVRAGRCSFRFSDVYG